jgi:cytochrome c-type biogenesis protein CcmH
VTVLLTLIFALFALAAAGFVIRRRRVLPSVALALFVMGVGTGAYLLLGRPGLALRALAHDDTKSDPVAKALAQARATPHDSTAWRTLGRAYLDARDGNDALKALARAIEVSRASGTPDAGAYSDYGMALVAVSSDKVTDDAERAFRTALEIDPGDRMALFFLGQSSAEHGRGAEAATYWQQLLGELPQDSPFRKQLTDDIAKLKVQK